VDASVTLPDPGPWPNYDQPIVGSGCCSGDFAFVDTFKYTNAAIYAITTPVILASPGIAGVVSVFDAGRSIINIASGQGNASDYFNVTTFGHGKLIDKFAGGVRNVPQYYQAYTAFRDELLGCAIEGSCSR